MRQNALVLPAPTEAVDVARILRRLMLARLGGPPSRGSMCLAVRSTDGAMLMVKSSYRRTWGLPGGFLNPGEDPIRGGERELVEETGAVLHNPRLIVRWKRAHHTDHLVAGVVTNTPVATSWEISEIRWIAVREVTKQNRDQHAITHAMLRGIPGGLSAFVGAMLDDYHGISP